MEWISVDERLPDDYCYCLVLRKYHAGGELSTHYSFLRLTVKLQKDSWFVLT